MALWWLLVWHKLGVRSCDCAMIRLQLALIGMAVLYAFVSLAYV